MRSHLVSLLGVSSLYFFLLAPLAMLRVTTTKSSACDTSSTSCRSESDSASWRGQSLDEQARQLPLRPRIFPGLKDRSMQIQAKSKTKICCFCKVPGHHVGNCVKALEDRVAHVAVDCARGVHYPFLHGVWRCEWCWEHLDERDVYKHDPALWRRETCKEREKWDRYMDPTLHDWQ